MVQDWSSTSAKVLLSMRMQNSLLRPRQLKLEEQQLNNKRVALSVLPEHT